jgi:hypothetical protein
MNGEFLYVSSCLLAWMVSSNYEKKKYKITSLLDASIYGTSNCQHNILYRF